MDKKQVYLIGAVLSACLLLVGAIGFYSKEGGREAARYGADGVYPGDNLKGSGKVFLLEYADFECPACAAYHPILKEALKGREDKVSYVYRHFPLPQHQNARLAAYAAEAAGKYDKFFEMSDILFSRQKEWATSLNPKELFVSYANELGINTEWFAGDLEDQTIVYKVSDQLSSGSVLGVNSTPTFFINGQKIGNPASLEALTSLLDQAPASSVLNSAGNESWHTHADLSVYVDGKKLDLSLEKYQSKEGAEKNEWAHLHSGNGNVVHFHKPGIKLSEFFKSLGIDFTDNCLVLDTGEKYCGGSDNTLKFFVNGEPNRQFGNYEPEDLDRLLVSYGPKSEPISFQLESVSRDACIYSETCPERGTPPKEECVGGLGTSCD